MAVTNISVVKDYFGATNKELIDLKNADPDALAQLANGIKDGSYTY